MGSKWMWVWVVVVFMFVSLEGCLSQECWEEERVALVQLKHFFNDPNSLQDWVEGEQNSNCCDWSSVFCNYSTGRVAGLDLDDSRDRKLGEYWYLNASLFSAFEELEFLDLSSNSIAGFVANEGLDKLSRLSNLKFLYLDNNMFNNSILSSLGTLSSLKEIYLNDNGLEGIVDVSELDSLYNLDVLDMSSNRIGEIKSLKDLKGLTKLYLQNVSIHNGSGLLQSLSSFPSLKTLDLSYNNFSETTTTQEYLHNVSNLEVLYLDGSSMHISLLQGIAVVTSPRNLYMQNCQLNGVLRYLHNVSNMEFLYLDGSSLHISLLQSIAAFTSLKYFTMSGCQLNGILDFQGSDWLSKLSNLEDLDLSENMFNNSILSSLNVLSSLKSLHLSGNRLKGIVEVADSLYNLELLDMSDNKVDKFIFPKGLKKLEILYLHNVSVDDGSSLLQSLGSLPSLTYLGLSNNSFSESKTTKEYLRNFTNLVWLTLDGSSLHISLFQSIAAFTSLDTLYMYYCQLNGTTSSFQDLPNLKNLKNLYMDYTILDTSFLQIIGLMTSLETLSLSHCGLQSTFSHQDGDIILAFLRHQQDLQSVDLSHNNLTGKFPNWLLENNTKLETLDLSNNSFGGRFPLPIHAHVNLTRLDISDNSFCGHIPNELGKYLPSLEKLNLSKNHFDGSIPSSIGDMNSLNILDLSYNKLAGKIPEHLIKGCTFLEILVLSNNNLQGWIFSAEFNLTSLAILQLDGNSFTGSIPDSLSNASNLVGLYLSDNKLSGRIPSWLGNMSELRDIIMPNNHFEGPIPLETCQHNNQLRVLNLAENNLFGSLPSCFSLSLLTKVHLSKNKLQGQLKDAFFKSVYLETLDLGYNRLEGGIPTWIGEFSQLTYLILSNNKLEGQVPTQLCQLNKLRMLDLSHNNLFGRIPSCLDFTALHGSDQHEEVADFRCYGFYSGTIVVFPCKGESVEFTTKTISYSYHGKVLTYMSGIDLSSNKLIGSIPQQFGNLTRIHTLNLSHNNLTGPIPPTLSKLNQIESLDLSYNNLHGKIPPQLVELYTLSSFSVAHNNLSGKTPERTAQFITFGENSYEGNPFLCGPPLRKSCDTTRPQSPRPRASADNAEGDDFIDMDIFYMSFIGSYVIVLLGIAAILYINPYWRRAWFYHVEMWMTSCYYFVVDCLPRRFRH